MGSGKDKVVEKGKKPEAKPAEKGRPEVKKKVLPPGVRGIVRIAEGDMDGSKKLTQALLKIKGIGPTLANAIPKAAGIDGNVLAGVLTDQQVEHLEDVMLNPMKYGIPIHLINRRSDPFTGENKQLVSSELAITIKADIDSMKKIRCYRGIRHELGLPVRGQRTRSSFRTGMTAGVTRAKVVAAAVSAKAAPAPGAAKPAATAPAAPGAKPAAAPAAKPGAPAPAKKEEKK